MRRISILCMLIALVETLGNSPAARAEMVTAELNGNSIGTVLNPSAPVTINMGDGSTSSYMSYDPGVVNWVNDTKGPSSLSSHFTTFCIELTQDITLNTQYTYNLTALQNAPNPGTTQSGDGMGLAKATKIEELWTGYYNTIATAGTNAGTYAAAFQLAIWKIEYDYNSSFSGNDWFTQGNFLAKDNSAATQLATSWLQSIWTSDAFTPASDLVALSNPNLQDQVTELPAPSSLSLASAAGVVLAFLGYRRRRPTLAAARPA